ncbi:hypothetical protein HA052_11120 [Chromobacterium haemolyticum]|uniref:Recombinase RecT n=1 Tax=Chromobacterium fluminis TaxID=3044269 RepID=A0ABX0L850_9NEIS|nr:hypothetical protein [Chromobacterium haemolyticum]NHR05751.1 hypothetical protein [Chromobacterium haemolyticum]
MTEVATSIHSLRNQPPAEASLPVVRASFFDLQGFELLQRVAKAFASSTLVPQTYQGNVANCMIALNLAERLRADALMVMQNLYIVHGNPGWSSKFLIASVNTCGRYESLRYEWRGEKGADDYGCRAWTVEKSTGEKLHGVWIDWKMVKAEGWNKKSGSKWLTMEDQMFVYRSAAFWQRAYAPEISMGLPSQEELADTYDAKRGEDGVYEVPLEDLQKQRRAPRATASQAAALSAPDDVDTSTGEVLSQQQFRNAMQQRRQAEQVRVNDDRGDASEPEQFDQINQPTLEEALAFVRKGDPDMARDIARSLSEKDQAIVEQTINNQQASADRPRRQRNLE